MSDIYLAARYSRRLELCDYRARLEELGFTITSRWLDGAHQLANDGTPIGDAGEALVENGDGDRATELRAQFATDDFEDVAAAHTLIAFTEQPRAGTSRGGRHVELGLALAWAKRVIVVGPRENVFCWLPFVEQFDTWDEALAAVRTPTRGAA